MIARKIMSEVTFLGGVLFYLLICLYFFFTQEFNYLLILGLGLAIIYLVTFIIRLFYFKPRPEKRKYKTFLQKIDASSFPSIHAARATFLFLFFEVFFFEDVLLSFFALILMFSVYLSRIYLKKHDLIDILGGILLGIALSFLFLII